MDDALVKLLKRYRGVTIALVLAGLVWLACGRMLRSTVVSNLGMLAVGRALATGSGGQVEAHFEDATALLESAQHLHAGNASAHYGLGRIHESHGEHAEAAAEWIKAGWTEYDFLVRGEHFLRRDGFEASRWWYQQAREAGDELGREWMALGVSGEELRVRAERAFRQGRYGEAQLWYEQGAQLASASGDGQFAGQLEMLGIIVGCEQARSKERYRDAIACCSSVLKEDAGLWSTAWWLQYLALAALGEAESAVAKLGAATAWDDGWLDEDMRFEAWSVWAARVQETSTAAEVIDAAQHAISVYPGGLTVQRQLADLYIILSAAQRSLGNAAEGVESLQEAVRLSERDSWLRVELGEALFQSDPLQGDQANDEFASALRLTEDSVPIWKRVLGFWINWGEAERAVALGTLVPAQDVISVTAVVRWGDQTKDVGPLEEALAWYEVAADLHPDQSSSALLRQHGLWDEAGDSDRAHALLEEAVRVDEGWRAPDEQAEAWRLWGLFLYEEERFAEAVEALTRAVEVRPKVGGTRYYLSEALHQLGMSQFAERDLKGALQSLAEALSANSRNLWAHVNYGKVLYLYDSSQAHVSQNHFLLATELNSDSVNLWANLINFWKSMGENGLADDLCDQASAEVREDLPLRLCTPQ